MFIDFSVKNYRSIKELVLLSAIAQKDKTPTAVVGDTKHIKSDNEIAPPTAVEGWGFELLPALAIFGANASGKSNVITSLDFLLGYMAIGAMGGMPMNRTLLPFLFDANQHAAPTCFEIRVALKQTVFTYSLEVNHVRVLKEKLEYAVATTKKDRLLYLRTWDEIKQKYVWKNGSAFHGPHQQLEGSINASYSFMSLLVRLDVTVVNPLTQWVRSRALGTSLGFEGMDEQNITDLAYSNPVLREALSLLIKKFDTGISRIEVTKNESHSADEKTYNVWAYHNTKYGEEKLPLMWESTGTQKLWELLGRILNATSHGTLLLIDELGSSIHPNIAREIVKLFQNPKTNPNRAQLIFTSHDNTLQRNRLLRRDQIWFTQKDVEGKTELYPLSDFKPRNDAAIDKSYLDGRYGAVPILPDEEELAAITTGQRNAA